MRTRRSLLRQLLTPEAVVRSSEELLQVPEVFEQQRRRRAGAAEAAGSTRAPAPGCWRRVGRGPALRLLEKPRT